MDFVPREYCGWNHRFDDLGRRFRTLYCAGLQVTAFREALACLRTDTTAIREFRALFGETRGLVGRVTTEWRRELVLAPARIEILAGELVDIDDVALRRRLEWEHASLLEMHDMKNLDISQVRSKTRVVTQTITGSLYDQGTAGILFRSNLDDRPCLALFEGRARLVPDGEAVPLIPPPRGLVRVCREFQLTLE